MGCCRATGCSCRKAWFDNYLKADFPSSQYHFYLSSTSITICNSYLLTLLQNSSIYDNQVQPQPTSPFQSSAPTNMRFVSLIAAISMASLASVAEGCQASGTIGSTEPDSSLRCCSDCAWNSYIRNNVSFSGSDEVEPVL